MSAAAERRTVAVAKGGTSLEHEVSRRGARRVEAALIDGGYTVVPIEIGPTFVDRIKEIQPAFVCVIAHGRGGEDGTLQELLEVMRVPFTGSGSIASALCMDKVALKRELVREGLHTPRFHSFSRKSFQEFGAAGVLADILEELGLPLVVKPVRGGSSLGIKLVEKADDLIAAVLAAFAYDDRILIEEHVVGCEVGASVLMRDGEPVLLPLVEIMGPSGLYDYEAHYDIGVAELRAPAHLDAEVAARAGDAAVRAFTRAGCRDLARVDIIVDAEGLPQILEINTIPGFTETGPTPNAADAAGLSFTELVESMCSRAAGERGRA